MHWLRSQLIFLLTSLSRNRKVTHYAEPFGYIFYGSDLSGFSRSDPAGCARSSAEGNSAGGRDRAGVSGFTAGHLETSASAAPRASGAGKKGRPTPALPAQRRTFESRQCLGGTVPRFLANQPDEFKD